MDASSRSGLRQQAVCLAGLLMQLRSLLNDLGYARRIAKGLNNLLEIRKRFKDDSLRSHLEMFDEDTALVAI